MAQNTFDVIMLHGRPAAGKSEVIDYLKRTPVEKRVERFHVGEFQEIDDFPMLWTWFEEDDVLEKLGHPRIHTTPDVEFKWTYLWDLLIRRIGLEHKKKLAENPSYHERFTSIVEFSRGTEHGGYVRAYEHMDEELLSRGAILYINVSFEESLRKNRKRFNPELAHSILHHGLTDEKLFKLYKEVDFHQFIAGTENFVEIKGIKVPYVIFENEDDVTSPRGDALGQRLEECFQRLWTISKNLRG